MMFISINGAQLVASHAAAAVVSVTFGWGLHSLRGTPKRGESPLEKLLH